MSRPFHDPSPHLARRAPTGHLLEGHFSVVGRADLSRGGAVARVAKLFTALQPHSRGVYVNFTTTTWITTTTWPTAAWPLRSLPSVFIRSLLGWQLIGRHALEGAKL
jgi:hypothetical protein